MRYATELTILLPSHERLYPM